MREEPLTKLQAAPCTPLPVAFVETVLGKEAFYDIGDWGTAVAHLGQNIYGWCVFSAYEVPNVVWFLIEYLVVVTFLACIRHAFIGNAFSCYPKIVPFMVLCFGPKWCSLWYCVLAQNGTLYGAVFWPKMVLFMVLCFGPKWYLVVFMVLWFGPKWYPLWRCVLAQNGTLYGAAFWPKMVPFMVLCFGPKWCSLW